MWPALHTTKGEERDTPRTTDVAATLALVIELVVLATEALLTLGGPVARVWKRRGVEQALQTVSNGIEASNDRSVFSREITERLYARGVRQTDCVALAGFVQSDSGALLMRLTALAALAGPTQVKVFKESVVSQAEALIRLHARAAVDYALVAAPIIVEEFLRSIEAAYDKIRRGDPDLASEIRDTASHERQTQLLLNAGNLADRGRSVAQLYEVLPSTVEAQVSEYATYVAELTELLTIPTVQRDIRVPIDRSLVRPRLAFVEPATSLQNPRIGASSDVDTAPLLDFLATNSRIVLLGDPGGGKSTSVMAALHKLSRAIQSSNSGIVPFRVVLRHYASAVRNDHQVGILMYLHQQLVSEYGLDFDLDALKYLLHTGRAAVFFDGLDEILETDLRRDIVQKMDGFCSRFSACAYVVTSRAVGYEETPMHKSFRQVAIDPFDNRTVAEYVRNFLELEDTHVSTDLDDRVLRFMEESRSISDIRSNPLMLGVLCNLYSTGRNMPSNRADLYRKCAQMLFSEWDASKGTTVSISDQESAELAIREWALEVFLSGQEEFAVDDLHTHLVQFYARETGASGLAADLFARAAMGLWRGRRWVLGFAGSHAGSEHYRFTHRTFLEFFAAEQIVYDSSSAEILWQNTRKLVENRSGEVFCLLALQIMSERTKGAGDDFIRLAVERAHSLLDGSPRQSFNVTAFCCRALASTRSTLPVKREVGALAGRVIARIAPTLSSHHTAKRPLGLPSIAFIDVFDQTLSYLISEDEEEGDPEDIEATYTTIEHVSQIVRYAEPLREPEVGEFLAGIITQLTEMISSPYTWTDGSRGAMAFMQFHRFESWQRSSESFRVDVHAAATQVWSQVIDTEAPPGFDDFWVSLALLRSGGKPSRPVLNSVGIPGLFVGSWPYSILGDEDGTAAHSITLHMLGIESERAIRMWSAVDASAMVNSILRELRKDARMTFETSLDDFQFYGDATFSVRRMDTLPDSDEVLVLVFLLLMLRKLGDERFLRAAHRALPSDSQPAALVSRLALASDVEVDSELADLARTCGLSADDVKMLIENLI